MSGNSSQMSATVNDTSYLIRGLTPCTEYTICVSAVSTSNQNVQSEENCDRESKTYTCGQLQWHAALLYRGTSIYICDPI